MSFKTNPIAIRASQQTSTLNNLAIQTYFLKNSIILLEFIKIFCLYKKIQLVNIKADFEKRLFLLWITYYNNKNVFKPKNLLSNKVSCNNLYDKYLKNINRFLFLIQNKYLWNFNISWELKRKKSMFIFMQLKNHIFTLILKKKIESYMGLETYIKFKNIKLCLKITNRSLNKKVLRYLATFRRKPNIHNIINIINLTTYCKYPSVLSDFLVDILSKLKKTQRALIYLVYKIVYTFLKIRINIFGLQIQIQGRLEGRRRKKTIQKLFGSMPLQTIKSKITYSLSQNYNKFGMFSVAVWLHYY